MEHKKRYLSNGECYEAAFNMVKSIAVDPTVSLPPWKIYGVPRGGIPVIYLLAAACREMGLSFDFAKTPTEATLFVDDIIDSGTTKGRFASRYKQPFFALTDFLATPRNGEWIVFPWEHDSGQDQSATDIVTRLLQYIGEDPSREGLMETPQRVLKAWKEWTSGYGIAPSTVLKTFEDGGRDYDEMVIVRDLPFYSTCEHHLAPFFGTATIAYVPKKRIVGLSKLGRLLEVFARRLQVQERLTTQVADALHDALDPLGVAVLLKARHLCMESRGLSRQGHDTVTSAVRGVFREEGNKAREEFLQLCK